MTRSLGVPQGDPQVYMSRDIVGLQRTAKGVHGAAIHAQIDPALLRRIAAVYNEVAACYELRLV